MLTAHKEKSTYTEWFLNLVDIKRSLHCYPSLTVQEVKIRGEDEDGKKWGVTTWSMMFERGGIGPVNQCVLYLVTMGVLFQGSVENLAHKQPDVLFMVHMKDSVSTTAENTKLHAIPPLHYLTNDDAMMCS